MSAPRPPPTQTQRLAARYNRVVKVAPPDGVDPQHPLLRLYEREATEAGLNSAQADRVLAFFRKVAPP